MKTKRNGKLLLSILFIAILSSSAMAQSKEHDHKKHGHGKHHGHYGKGSLSEHVYRITSADSMQIRKMKPALDKATKQLEALRANHQKLKKNVLDSLSLQLKSILKEDQLKKLDAWRNEKKEHNSKSKRLHE